MQFTVSVENITSVLYTLQINAIANGISMSAAKPYLIILANLVVFAAPSAQAAGVTIYIDGVLGR